MPPTECENSFTLINGVNGNFTGVETLDMGGGTKMTLYDVFALFGGLGLFLYGMDMMGKGLESAAGNKLKQILEKLTTNRIMGVLVGTLVTMIIQSSSATTVMLVGFVNAGLMNLSQAFGVMLGANIGTTITAQIIAFNISDWAPLFIILGVLPMMFGKKRSVRSIGTICAGFGILFLGMNMMGDAMIPLRNEAWFVNLMTSFDSPLWGVMIGLLVTAIIQSSSASVGILQALAAQGLVSLSAGLYIVLGCNIGTCATALLSSLGTNAMARRTAVMHLINKTVGAIVFTIVVWSLPIADIVASWSPGDPSRQIANFHTVFNILNTLMLLPFGSVCIKLAYRIVRSGGDAEREQQLLFVDDHVLETPSIATVQMQKELGRLADKANKNFRLSLEAFFEKNDDKAQTVVENEKTINTLCGEVMDYLVKIQQVEELAEADKQQIFEMHETVSNIERISDHAENIAEYAHERILNNSPFSDTAIDQLRQMAGQVQLALDASVRVLKHEGDVQKARSECQAYEEEVDALHKHLREDHIQRLQHGACDPRAGMIFADMAIDLERVSDHATNLAGLDEEVEKHHIEPVVIA